MANAENFHGGFHSVAQSGHLYLECTICDVTITRHIHVSKEKSNLTVLVTWLWLDSNKF